ncbi:hypothetical protein [Inquilinus limosus]|uniref:DUF4145 domain-containing protein n=1 Tax=Inquilinus limosus MP06 TaxID=1398085 RepID=A0A0A0CWR1_9PROT|nr:hypothetical protein [Inquilinus limosus]KGM30205.1 hypothetical protein P409_34455 [Inquilinus limosus MP06]
MRSTGDEAEDRTRWFAGVMAGRGAGERRDPGIVVGDHTQALLVELETVFGAGAWVATTILSVAVIEAHLREQAMASGRAVDPYLNAGRLFAEAGLDERFDTLRRARNRALHVSDPPTLTVDMHWFEAERLEAEARFAIRLVAAALYGGALPEEPEEEA